MCLAAATVVCWYGVVWCVHLWWGGLGRPSEQGIALVQAVLGDTLSHYSLEVLMRSTPPSLGALH